MKIFYNYEAGSYRINTTYQSKVGLMYYSDYMFATLPTYWTYPAYSENEPDYSTSAQRFDNWLHGASRNDQLTITRVSDRERRVISVDYRGLPGISYAKSGGIFRPTFYLVSSIKYSSGSGTSTDPYRIS